MIKVTAHSLLNKLRYNRNKLKDLLSDIEFGDEVVDSDSLKSLQRLLVDSDHVMIYLSSVSPQVRLNLPDDLQIIYNELETKLREFGRV